MKQKIKNIFRKPTKKALGKLGLFLIFGMMVMNVNFFDSMGSNNYPKVKLFQVSIAAEGGYLQQVGEITVGGPTAGAQAGQESGNILIDWVLRGIEGALKALVNTAGLLVDKTLDQKLFDDLVGKNNKVYVIWSAVRDLTNMFFMILLLFSAFATIFQVEKYHLRKVIIMLIVMALLVNFSFVIARFIIDFSNSAMYFLIDLAFGDIPSKSAGLAKFSNFGAVLGKINADSKNLVTTQLLLSIVFHFIVFVTFISIGINLLIRIVAFMILLMLAPAGFTFAFFPDTKNVSSDWWGALFRYAFLGPIMVFFLYVAMALFGATVASASPDDSFMKAAVDFVVPIVFLWMGLIASQKFGGDGAGVAMSIARGTGNRVRRYSQTLAWGGTRMAGRGIDNAFGAPVAGTWNAVKNRWNQFGEDYKTASDRRAAEVGDRIGVRGANEKLVRENLKRLKDEGSSEAELTRLANGTVAERMASALFRAENNRFDNDPAIAQAQYNNAMNAVRGHQVYENQFLGNARKTNMDLVINERITQSGANTPAAIQTIARDELGRLDPDQWRDQNIVRMVANTTPNRGTIIAEGANVISRYSQQGQDNVTRNMRGLKLEAGSQSRNNGVGFWA